MVNLAVMRNIFSSALVCCVACPTTSESRSSPPPLSPAVGTFPIEGLKAHNTALAHPSRVHLNDFMTDYVHSKFIISVKFCNNGCHRVFIAIVDFMLFDKYWFKRSGRVPGVNMSVIFYAFLFI